INEDTYEGDIKNPLSLNLYTYGHNNPLRYIDPTGHNILEVYLYEKTGYHKYKNDWVYYSNNLEDIFSYYTMGWKEILTLIYSKSPKEITDAIGDLAMTFIPLGGHTSKVAKVGKWTDKTGKVTEVIMKGLRNVTVTEKKLQHEWKHAKDFGILGNWNKKQGALYSQAISKHLESSTDVWMSKYRGQEVFVHYDSATGIGSYIDMDGGYVGGWKFSDDQLKFHRENGTKIY
ncbi:colicin D domain-containing protein, partial [Paenibacillus sp. KS1]|uniref:colicin D domain-containing protein n=1 Tax=Paenibacillus sp. KS1 TaxID=1849249 RepID=UPI000ABC340D